MCPASVRPSLSKRTSSLLAGSTSGITLVGSSVLKASASFLRSRASVKVATRVATSTISVRPGNRSGSTLPTRRQAPCLRADTARSMERPRSLVLEYLAVLGVASRRYADEAFERVGEVALIVEAGLPDDLGDRPAPE